MWLCERRCALFFMHLPCVTEANYNCALHDKVYAWFFLCHLLIFKLWTTVTVGCCANICRSELKLKLIIHKQIVWLKCDKWNMITDKEILEENTKKKTFFFSWHCQIKFRRSSLSFRYCLNETKTNRLVEKLCQH